MTQRASVLSGLATTALPAIVIFGIGGALSGGSSDLWYANLQKPPLTPPDITFAIVWPILFALMIVSAFLVWRTAKGFANARPAFTVYFIQLIFNLGWSVLFFTLHRPLLAIVDLVILWVLVCVMIVRFAHWSRLAALAQLPYLLWLTFAGYLNAGIIVLN